MGLINSRDRAGGHRVTKVDKWPWPGRSLHGARPYSGRLLKIMIGLWWKQRRISPAKPAVKARAGACPIASIYVSGIDSTCEGCRTFSWLECFLVTHSIPGGQTDLHLSGHISSLGFCAPRPNDNQKMTTVLQPTRSECIFLYIFWPAKWYFS